MSIINNIVEFARNSKSTMITTGGGVLASTVNVSNINMINTAFQHLAWTVAIIAGILNIYSWIKKNNKNNKFSKHEKK